MPDGLWNANNQSTYGIITRPQYFKHGGAKDPVIGREDPSVEISILPKFRLGLVLTQFQAFGLYASHLTIGCNWRTNNPEATVGMWKY